MSVSLNGSEIVQSVQNNTNIIIDTNDISTFINNNITYDNIVNGLGYTPANVTSIPSSIVQYSPQTLTTLEQTQARENIGVTSYTLPMATNSALGGVYAEPISTIDTQAVRVDSNGFLYTAPGLTGEYVAINGTTPMTAQLMIGTNSTTSFTGVETKRKIGSSIVSAGFYVNSDGSSKFVNKSVSSNSDLASLIFSNSKFQYIIGASSTGTAYNVYCEHNLSPVQYVSQTLTSAEQQQARTNIDSLGSTFIIDCNAASTLTGDEIVPISQNNAIVNTTISDIGDSLVSSKGILTTSNVSAYVVASANIINNGVTWHYIYYNDGYTRICGDMYTASLSWEYDSNTKVYYASYNISLPCTFTQVIAANMCLTDNSYNNWGTMLNGISNITNGATLIFYQLASGQASRGYRASVFIEGFTNGSFYTA